MDNFKIWLPAFQGKTEIACLEDGGTAFQLEDEQGSMKKVCYRVFPGIHLIYNDIHMEHCNAELGQKQNIIEIDHCREGRLECRVGQDSFYLAPGDISIHRFGEGRQENSFPTGYYRGITIQIDLDASPQCLACFLEGVDVEPVSIAHKFRLDGIFSFALRQPPGIEHIFSELYEVPKSIQAGYFKVKILELLLFLSSLEPGTDQLEQRRFSETQAMLARQICSYLTDHLEQHITLAELAEHFGVSTSQIKNSFGSVYGTTPQIYTRSQRMRAAAVLLRQTDRSVLDIAGQFGYDNASKFAGVFRQVMGVTPTQYRKGLCHQK